MSRILIAFLAIDACTAARVHREAHAKKQHFTLPPWYYNTPEQWEEVARGLVARFDYIESDGVLSGEELLHWCTSISPPYVTYTDLLDNETLVRRNCLMQEEGGPLTVETDVLVNYIMEFLKWNGIGNETDLGSFLSLIGRLEDYPIDSPESYPGFSEHWWEHYVRELVTRFDNDSDGVLSGDEVLHWCTAISPPDVTYTDLANNKTMVRKNCLVQGEGGPLTVKVKVLVKEIMEAKKHYGLGALADNTSVANLMQRLAMYVIPFYFPQRNRKTDVPSFPW